MACRFGKLNFTKVQRQLCDAEGCDASKLISYLFENKDYERFFNIKYINLLRLCSSNVYNYTSL